MFKNLPDKPFKKLLQNIQKSGKSYKESSRRIHDISVSIEDLKDIFIGQGGKCYYSKQEMDLNEIFIANSIEAMSADRIDNKRSYSKDNIVLCKRFYNNGRNNASVDAVMNVIGKNKGILYKARCYLIGSIEDAKDFGVGWRENIKNKTKDIGVIYFDPCKDKPFIKDMSETSDLQATFKAWRKAKKYAKLSEKMREIRIHDLSLCDKADFIIFNFDPDVMTCGSWEEFFVSNRNKRPIFFICEKGLDRIPLWMYGTLSHKYFYDSLDSVVEQLTKINSGEVAIDSDRWRLLKEDFR